MTHVERHINELCKQRSLEIAQDHRQAISAVPDEIAWEKLPVAVRILIQQWVAAENIQNRVTNKLRTLGFQTYNLRRRKSVYRLHGPVEAAKTKVNQQRDQRSEAIKKLKTAAVIESLGKPTAECRALLKDLQKKLAKI